MSSPLSPSSSQRSTRRQRYIDARAAQTLQFEWPQALPVVERLEELRAAIDKHQVVIVAGETGSGKSTQLPKLCLQMGRGIAGMIAHTQPRRLAARTVAQRVADELHTPLGDAVGYQVRFDAETGESTRLKVMTDGMLLAELSKDPMLRRYDTIIIDEAHERSLNIDFLLGFLKTLLPQRPGLKLLITSATIDTGKFSRFFADAPVIEVSGRSFPVDVRYHDEWADDLNTNGFGPAIAATLTELKAEGVDREGGVLVFLSGEAEIRDVAKYLRGSGMNLDVLPLYARLGLRDQQRIFSEGGRDWRIILATNVAETSLTVPGIRAVIDTGFARVARYSHRSRLQRLPVEAVSQASANQRSGRCGRTGPGIAVRLYSESDFLSRELFTQPEIQRSSLAAVILQLLRLGVADVAAFPFIDPPDGRFLREGFKTLSELGAVKHQKITALGRQLAQFPVDPPLARMLVYGNDTGCLREMLVIVSGLAGMDPRERPQEKRAAADQCHARFRHPESDFMSWVQLWEYADAQREALSSSAFRRLCGREFLSWRKLRDWRDVHRQLVLQCRTAGFSLNQEPADLPAVHTALLSGLISNVGRHEEQGEYSGTQNRQFRIFPGTGLKRKTPKWVVAAEIVETRQVYARCVAKVEPAWIIAAADHLLKRNYAEPHWQTGTGRVMAKEKLSLYGLPLGDGVLKHFGAIDPVVSHDILIRAGLVEGRMKTRAPFFAHNQSLLKKAREEEHRIRRRDVVASDDELCAWYAARIPAEVVTTRQLEAWLKRQGQQSPQPLLMNDADVFKRDNAVDGEQFPAQLTIGELQLPLKYQFEPGHESDGVSLTVPVAALNRIPAHAVEWLVPGMLAEKCEQLLRSLPRQLRKQIQPVPDLLAAVLPLLNPGEGSLTDALAAAVKKVKGVELPPDAWRAGELPDYFRMNIRITDERGALIEQGRDFDVLRARYAGRTREDLQQQAEHHYPAGRLTEWSFDALEKEQAMRAGGVELRAYPALVDHGDGVEITMLDTGAAADLENARGTARLYALRLSQPVGKLRNRVWRENAQQLQFAATGQKREAWFADLILAAVRLCFFPDGILPRDKAEFDALWQSQRSRFKDVVEIRARLLAEVLAAYAGIVGQLKTFDGATWQPAVDDISAQLQQLFVPGFIWLAGENVVQYPRYLHAIAQRLEQLRGNLNRDNQHRQALVALAQPLFDRGKNKVENIINNKDLYSYYNMLQEYRISLFAQHLGTLFPVSEKRLRRRWAEISGSN